jgi:hypothetical protein
LETGRNRGNHRYTEENMIDSADWENILINIFIFCGIVGDYNGDIVLYIVELFTVENIY